jgi:hypothetical protein
MDTINHPIARAVPRISGFASPASRRFRSAQQPADASPSTPSTYGQVISFIFDNAKETSTPAHHVMTSGALPAALPTIEIEGEYCLHGGIVSNTPLQYLLAHEENLSSLVFQVDLFSARGSLPGEMRDVLGRHKDTMFSSRTRQDTDHFRKIHALRHRLVSCQGRNRGNSHSGSLNDHPTIVGGRELWGFSKKTCEPDPARRDRHAGHPRLRSVAHRNRDYQALHGGPSRRQGGIGSAELPAENHS